MARSRAEEITDIAPERQTSWLAAEIDTLEEQLGDLVSLTRRVLLVLLGVFISSMTSTVLLFANLATGSG